MTRKRRLVIAPIWVTLVGSRSIDSLTWASSSASKRLTPSARPASRECWRLVRHVASDNGQLRRPPRPKPAPGSGWQSGGVFERFTDRARRVLVVAQEEARQLNHAFIGTEHILLGLLAEAEGVAGQAFRALDISLDAARQKVEETIGPSMAPPDADRPFTPRVKKVLELALREALQLGHSYIGTEHLLLGLVREGQGVGAQVLVDLGADPSRVRQQVMALMSGYQGAAPADVAGPVSVQVGAPTARFVTCSFCGKAPPESGQLVSSAGAFICEHCVREWFGRLRRETRGPGWVSPSHTVNPFEVEATGPPPEDKDAARAEIAAAFKGHGTLSQDGQSLVMVEDGENLGPTLIAAQERRANFIAPRGTSACRSMSSGSSTPPTPPCGSTSPRTDSRSFDGTGETPSSWTGSGRWRAPRSAG